MFSNIGERIKLTAKVLFWVGVGACVLGGFSTLMNGIDYYDSTDVATGLITMVFGPILVWFWSMMVYGFGTLIANSNDIVDKLYESDNNKGADR
jgi:Na+/pantothenate symporter